jgi:hypothetical protein
LRIFCKFPKNLPKVNTRRIRENSPNLVTLPTGLHLKQKISKFDMAHFHAKNNRAFEWSFVTKEMTCSPQTKQESILAFLVNCLSRPSLLLPTNLINVHTYVLWK